MRHVFRCTKIGWDQEQEGVWFDADQYSKESAEARFIPQQGVTQRGYPYTYCEYDGQKYHDIYYCGLYDDNNMPQNNNDVIDHMIHQNN